MLKILQARLQQYLNLELKDMQTGFRKGRRTRNKIANFFGSWKKQESSRKTSISASLTKLKPLTVWITTKLWRILKEMGIADHLPCLLRKLYEGQEVTVRTGPRTTDWFQTGKEVVQSCTLSPAYITYKQSTSCQILGWIKDKVESRLPGEISITSGMQMTAPLWQKAKRN